MLDEIESDELAASSSTAESSSEVSFPFISRRDKCRFGAPYPCPQTRPMLSMVEVCRSLSRVGVVSRGGCHGEVYVGVDSTRGDEDQESREWRYLYIFSYCRKCGVMGCHLHPGNLHLDRIATSLKILVRGNMQLFLCIYVIPLSK
jgi:hypothetical protein